MRRNDDFIPPRLKNGEVELPDRIDEYRIPREAIEQYIDVDLVDLIEPLLTAALTGPGTAWTNVGLTNGWTNNSGGEPMQYTISPTTSAFGGVVSIRGKVLNSSNRPAGNTFPLATLPTTARPARILSFPVSANNNQAAASTYLVIDTAGLVYYQGTAVGAGALLDFNVSFPLS